MYFIAVDLFSTHGNHFICWSKSEGYHRLGQVLYLTLFGHWEQSYVIHLQVIGVLICKEKIETRKYEKLISSCIIKHLYNWTITKVSLAHHNFILLELLIIAAL